ncbi:MAG: hypothetical protein HY291_23640 [Planctomycetes bacterium]|nr:hypothetical protein [Planctomycetota bacterium]
MRTSGASKALFASALLIFALALPGAEPAPQPPAEKPAPPAPDAKRVKELAGNLASETYDEREQAQQELVKMGEAVVAELEKLKAEITDAEAQARVERIKTTFADRKLQAELDALKETMADAANHLENGIKLNAAKAKLEEVAGLLKKRYGNNAVQTKVAELYLQMGQIFYRSYRVAEKSKKDVLAEAQKLLEKSVDAYDEYLQAHPDDVLSTQQQTEAQMILYACRKYRTL